MATLESLDARLAESLQCLDDAARELRQLHALDPKPHLPRIGNAMYSIWELRNALFALRPELRPDFVVEHTHDRPRYDRLQTLYRDAEALERTGDWLRATDAYRTLRTAAERGYFAVAAEAGLFRIAERQTPGG